jgi:filamentous hemagglutinin family protein
MRPARQAGAGPHRGLAIAMCIWPAAALAGAVTDGSVGAVQHLSGQFVVPQTLGTVKGGNLFHSFASFGVASGESATFTTTSASIRNVISRVTGGEPSAIYGPLSLQAAAGSHPDFFFINPAGVLFGAGAQIDVPGGFHVSTAQQLKFADGFVWDTGSPTVSGLTVAAPEAFGFLGGNARAAVRFTNLDPDGNAGDSPTVTLPAGSSLTIAAGDVEFSDTTLQLPAVTAQVAAVGDRADRIALAMSDGELDRPLAGSLHLADSSIWIDGAGTVALRAGSVELLRSGVYALTMAPAAGARPGAIQVRATDEAWLRESQLFTYTESEVASSRISVVAGSLAIEGLDSGLSTTTDFGSGHAGDIDVVVRGRMTMSGGANIMSTTYSQGNAGAVSVRADSLRLEGNGLSTVIGSGAQFSTGHAGNVTVDVTKELALADDAIIMSVGTDGGSSGNIGIRAGTLDISCLACGSVTGVLSTVGNTVAGSGDAGAIDILVRDAMRLSGYVNIESTAVRSNGQAGNITIEARSLDIDGTGGMPWIESSSMQGSANAANISIHVTDNMTIAGSAQISSGTIFGGNAGSIDIRADKSLTASGFVSIDSSSYGSPNRDAGGVSIYAKESLSLADGAAVSGATFAGSGNAGAVVLRTDGNLTLDHAEITAQATGNARASNIDIAAGDRLTLKSSSVRTSAVDGDGGSIRLTGNLIRLTDSLVTTSVEGQTNGNGGNIDITGNALVLKSSFIQANTQAPQARGGNIRINTRLLIPEGGTLVLGGARVPFGSGYAGVNVIQAAAPDGVAGDLQITTPELNLAGTLSGLATPEIDFGPMARDQCRTGAGSSFTLMGSGALPASVADQGLFGR